MERTPVPGGFWIKMSPGELNRLTGISMHLGLVALSASQKESSTDPAEIQELNNDIKRHYEIIDRLMSASSDHQA